MVDLSQLNVKEMIRKYEEEEAVKLINIIIENGKKILELQKILVMLKEKQEKQKRRQEDREQRRREYKKRWEEEEQRRRKEKKRINDEWRKVEEMRIWEERRAEKE